MVSAAPNNIEYTVEGEGVNPRKRERSPFLSPLPASEEDQKDEWPEFTLERKNTEMSTDAGACACTLTI